MKLEDFRSRETISVLKSGIFAGTLSRTTHGARFTYDERFRSEALTQHHYGLAFSLSPKQPVFEITGNNLHPFFAGLLPEGLRLKALRQSLKTSDDDLFTMLAALGSNSIGDVYAEPDYSQEESPEEMNFASSSWEEVSFLELFEESIRSPDFRMREIDTGVPGVIPKISASMVSFPIRIKKKNREYILKLGTDEHPQLVRNEYFFMQMAGACGFFTAGTTLVRDRDGRDGLLVERFDREFEKEKRMFRRLHQEDACQFLGRYPQDKYRLSLREIAEGIAKFSMSPIIEIRRLIELYVFSYLIGNGDLHAKNVSLLEDTRGRIRLSPVYDMVSTLPYGDRKMAIKLGAKDDNFRLKDILDFGRQNKLPERAVQASIEKLIRGATQVISRVREIGLSEKQSADLERTFAERAGKLRP